MKAGVFDKIGSLSLLEKDIPSVQSAYEVKLKVEAASICGTDVHILSDPPGHPANTGVVLGHEFVGEVVEIGEEVGNVQIGDRVVVDPTLVCGDCVYCSNGDVNMCENMSTIGIYEDGGWATYCVVPNKNIHKISKNVPLEVAVLAEPLSCIINGMEKVNVQPGDSVVILGAGPMGQIATQVAKAAGAGKIICSDLSDYRLNYSKESGATRTVNSGEEDIEQVVKEETLIGADIIIDCVGVLMNQAISLVRRGGHVLLVGMNENKRADVKQYDITRNEIKIEGTYIQKFDFPKVVKLLEANLLNLDKLITHRVQLDEVYDGLEAMRSGKAIKVIVYP